MVNCYSTVACMCLLICIRFVGVGLDAEGIYRVSASQLDINKLKQAFNDGRKVSCWRNVFATY